MQKEKQSKHTQSAPKVFWCAILVSISIWVVYLITMSLIPWEDTQRGSFGDMFGAIGALFSGLAFAGVIATLWQQREDLQLQRKDLEMQTRMLESQKNEMEKQNKLSQLRDFEYTFFRLSDKLLDIRDKFAFGFGDDVYIGLSGMKKAYNTFVTYTTKNDEMVESDNKERPNEKYWEHIERNIRWSENDIENEKGRALPLVNRKASSFNDYLYSFSKIFKHTNLVGYAEGLIQACHYTDMADFLDDNEKKYYMRFVCNQLTNIERCILFYYGLAQVEIKNDYRLKNCVEKYSLLSHLDILNLVDITHGYKYPKLYNLNQAPSTRYQCL